MGIIGKAVGGPFAVLLAEQLFASGCNLIINITSAGRISPCLVTPSYILIDKALRDEGTSFHYLPPSRYVSKVLKGGSGGSGAAAAILRVEVVLLR